MGFRPLDLSPGVYAKVPFSYESVDFGEILQVPRVNTSNTACRAHSERAWRLSCVTLALRFDTQVPLRVSFTRRSITATANCSVLTNMRLQFLRLQFVSYVWSGK